MNIDIKRLRTDPELWPDGATHYDPEDGDWMKSEANGSVWYSKSGDQKYWFGPLSCLDVLGDVTAYIPRPESQQVEWDGMGDPPEDVECEISNCGQPYVWCKIRFMGDELCVVDHKNHVEQHYHLGSVEFRRIPTKEQREIEELSKLVCARGTAEDVAKHIIAAGYRKPE